MPRGLRIALIAVGVLLVLAIVADRISVRVAQSAIADRLQTQLELDQKPSVTAHGFPFLTQLFGGRYQDLEVTARGVQVVANNQKFTDLTVHADLRGVHAPFSDISGGTLEQVPVDHVLGTVALPYDQLSRVSGIAGLSITGDGQGGVRVAGRVTVPLLNQSISATAHGKVSVDSSGRLVLSADNVQVVGVTLPSQALSGVANNLSFTLPVRNLPFGLRLVDAKATATQLELTASADNVLLSKNALPTNAG